MPGQMAAEKLGHDREIHRPASAIAMAYAFAQVTRRPALVNLHSSAGVGNAMGNLVAAWHGNTPLIPTAGQQQRELMIGSRTFHARLCDGAAAAGRTGLRYPWTTGTSRRPGRAASGR